MAAVAIKVYIVLQRNNIAKGDDINARIIATKLTRRAAQDIVDANSGTWIEKFVADK